MCLREKVIFTGKKFEIRISLYKTYTNKSRIALIGLKPLVDAEIMITFI
jgi:hypothetical protein